MTRLPVGQSRNRGSVPGEGDTPTGAHSGFYSVGIGSSVSALKWPGRETHHSFPSSAAVKNDCSYFSNPPACLLGEHRDDFLFFVFTFLWEKRKVTVLQ